MLLAVSLALLVGVTLGLLGGGGSILTVPILAYVLGLPPKEAIASSLVVVGATAAVAVIPHARGGRVRWRIGLTFSAAGMVGAAGGGYAADFFSGGTLLVLFALMMLATGVAMLRGRRARVAGSEHSRPSAWLIGLEGLVVGAVTGLVGAGGGFLVVPALVLLGGLGIQEAIGTSLVVIALKSGAGFLGHAAHVDIDWWLAGSFTLAAILGSLGGTLLAARIPPQALRRGFGVFVLAMAGLVLALELGPSDESAAPSVAATVERETP